MTTQTTSAEQTASTHAGAAPAFASEAWCEAFAAALGSSGPVREWGASWNIGPLLWLVDGADEATAVLIRVSGDKGASASLVPAARAGVAAPTHIGATRARWQQVLTEQRSVVDEITSARMHVRGDLPTLARSRELLAALVAAAASVETSWPS